MDDFNGIEFSLNLSKTSKYLTFNIHENLSKFNVNNSEVPILVALYLNGDINQEDLYKIYQLNDSTVAKALLRLEEKGFIEREINPNDRRRRIVKLTSKGKEVSKKVLVPEDFFNKMFKNFSKEELLQLESLFNKLMNNIDNS